MTLRETRARLERYRFLAENHFGDLRTVVRYFANRGRLDDYRRQRQREEWTDLLAKKNRRRIVEARRIPAAVRREVLSLGVCAYCGDWPTTVDHIIPVSKGGDRRRSNLAPACWYCNKQKLDFTPDEWREWRLERGDGWPPLGEWERILLVMKRVTAATVEELTRLGKTEDLAELRAGGWLDILDSEPRSSPAA